MINMFACVVYSTSYLTVNFNFKLCVTLNPLQESTEEALFNVSFNVSAVSTICLVYKQMYCIACRVVESLCRHTTFSACWPQSIPQSRMHAQVFPFTGQKLKYSMYMRLETPAEEADLLTHLSYSVHSVGSTKTA